MKRAAAFFSRPLPLSDRCVLKPISASADSVFTHVVIVRALGSSFSLTSPDKSVFRSYGENVTFTLLYTLSDPSVASSADHAISDGVNAVKTAFKSYTNTFPAFCVMCRASGFNVPSRALRTVRASPSSS